MTAPPPGQQPSALCILKTPNDAVLILEGVRRKVMPRVTRRLTGHERQAIRAGTVWAWEEGETCMKRWTDGRRWGASRVGQGGFLLYSESTEQDSPPPSDPRYWPQHQPQKPQRHREILVKQTYSTTMIEDGKEKKWHVVAYASKYAPMCDQQGLLPCPQDLRALADVTIEPGRYPDWEQQCSTTEAYSRRPPPGVTISQPPIQTATERRETDRTSPPLREYRQVMYASPPYDPRELQDRRIPYPIQPPEQSYYKGRPGRSQYPGEFNDYPLPRRDDGEYLAHRPLYLPSPPGQYRDRYPQDPPSYIPNYNWPMQYRGPPPEIRTTFEPVDSKDGVIDHTSQDEHQLTVNRLPLTPNSANPNSPINGPSPRLSITNNLLNPPEDSSRATLTLPPLGRMGHEAVSPISNSSTGRRSPIGEGLPSEDARQLDGLGRKVY